MAFEAAGNITSQIADHLSGMIISGAMPGGTRIQEVKVASTLGVSRGSVREALLILQRMHLIEIVPRRGALVSELKAPQIGELLHLAATLDQHCLLKRSKEQSSSRVLNEIEACLEGMENAALNNDDREVLAARSNFYRLMASRQGSHVLAVLECVLPSMERLLFRLMVQGQVEARDLLRYYRAIFVAQKMQDLPRVEELLGAFGNRLWQLCAKSGWVEKRDCEPFAQVTAGSS